MAEEEGKQYVERLGDKTPKEIEELLHIGVHMEKLRAGGLRVDGNDLADPEFYLSPERRVRKHTNRFG